MSLPHARLALAAFALVALAAVSCKPAPPPPPPPVIVPPTGPDERVTAADQACAQDSDCALTTADCCGCSAMGSQIGVRADHVTALAARRTPICSGVSCAQAISDDPTCAATKAVCRAGVCAPDVAASATMTTTTTKPVPVEPIPPG